MIKKELKSLNFKWRKKRQDEDYKSFLFVSECVPQCVACGLVIAGWSMAPADKILIHKLMMLRIAARPANPHHQDQIPGLLIPLLPGHRLCPLATPASLASNSLHACILGPGMFINNQNFPILGRILHSILEERCETFDWEMTVVDWPFMDTPMTHNII